MAEIDSVTRHSVELFLARVRPRHGIVEAWLYGSRARGDAQEDSDVDVALVIEGDERSKSDVLDELSDAAYDVMMETGRFISPLPVRADAWREPATHSNPFLLANIRRDGIAL